MPPFAISIRILAVLGCVTALYFGATILIPVTLGYFLFVLLDPIVAALATRGISRTLTSLVLVFASVTIALTMVWGFYGAFADIAREVPAYSQKIKNIVETTTKRAATLEKSATETVPQSKTPDDIQRVEVVEGYRGWTGFALKGLGTAVEALTSAFFIPLIALFLLLDRATLLRALKDLVPPTFDLTKVGNEIKDMIRSFFIENVIIGVGMSLFVTALYYGLGLHNAIPLGLATGFLNLIPLAGAFLSLALPILQGLLQFDSISPFLIIASTIIVMHFLVSNVLVPKVVGSHINVNVVAATIGLMFWGWAWGAIGLLFAVPLVALLKIILSHTEEWKKLSRLLSEPRAQKGMPSSVRSLLKK